MARAGSRTQSLTAAWRTMQLALLLVTRLAAGVHADERITLQTRRITPSIRR
ncbi:hypothetical protein RQP53_12200 [Paucibacter sp. APW11]|uniref:ESPR domain-containing protein n=1 Tax=Roseateles aquae TaxID=3077235 RepID=A0ABU3PD34_9BURK|nr:hypothetical protein [Paucibacter sp. APW11]MDT9000028.1 hypothetical protein [Paucibacter sp. APW11]